MKYDHKTIEKKWQEQWAKTELYRSVEDPAKKKCYVLDMFPYPSSQGLHVGHPEGYTATDIISRKRRMEGWNVLHPMGWDAFGLPAENYAVKHGIHPRESTLSNIETFRRQLVALGFSYDWSREVNTCDPAYYRWTQWLFLFLYKKGLAYKKKAPVNWCPACQTVLANEQVIDGACERCKSDVIQKELEQWFFKVTAYADRLLADVDKLDWPEKIKAMQRNWIGRSEGLMISFPGITAASATSYKLQATSSPQAMPSSTEFDITVFTTRPDTLYGVTYLVLAPEHPLTLSIVSPKERQHVLEYLAAARKKTELQRTGLDHEKTGVPLGICVKHPLTGADIPVWAADYVIGSYGTGAVMGVPAHDERDFEFAKKYNLPVKHVIVPPHDVSEAEHEAVHHAGADSPRSGTVPAYTAPGFMVNSGEFNGLTSEDAKVKISDLVEGRGLGSRQVQYRLRDWLVSRQRYWGAPIPIIYCEECGEVPVPEKDLPVLLPDDVDFLPTGESPLARSKTFHDVNCPRCGVKARRESDTMDTFVDSSWYFLRYCSPHESEAPFSRHAVEYWYPVDVYVGGAEHAVLHLLYARFFTKAIFDFGLLSFDEPFLKLRNQGLILGEDGQKMSKSRGNVINPDEVVTEYGADALRLYEMFMGEFEEPKPWSTQSIAGVRRFLDRVFTAAHNAAHGGVRSTEPEVQSPDLMRPLHRTIKKVSSDIESFKFNTAISALMILLNEWTAAGGASREFAETFLKLLCPFAPHISEELWHILGNRRSIFLEAWPVHDERLIAEEEIELVVQVDGRVRDRLRVSASVSDEDMKARALSSEKVRASIADKSVERVVVVKGRLVNIVTH